MAGSGGRALVYALCVFVGMFVYTRVGCLLLEVGVSTLRVLPLKVMEPIKKTVGEMRALVP